MTDGFRGGGRPALAAHPPVPDISSAHPAMRPPRLGGTRLVLVDGPSGSGKSTYAAGLAADLGATVVSTDDFATWDQPFAWWPRLVAGVLEPLSRGEPGAYRAIEWAPGGPRPGRTRTVDPPVTLIVEGVSAARRSVTGLASLVVWVEHGTAAARLERSVARDGERYRADLARWQRLERGWFAVDRPADRADHRLATT